MKELQCITHRCVPVIPRRDDGVLATDGVCVNIVKNLNEHATEYAGNAGVNFFVTKTVSDRALCTAAQASGLTFVFRLI